MENGVDRAPSITSVSGFTGSSHCANHAVWPELTDHVVTGVGDKERVAESDGETGGEIQLRLTRWFPITGIPGLAGARHRRDRSIRVDPPDAIVQRVGYVDVTHAVRGQPLRHV